MKAINLSMEPYCCNTILSCDIYKTVNQHFEAKISGYITDTIENVMKTAERSDRVIIYAEEDGEKKSIFRGTVCNLKIQAEGNLQIVTITAESITSRLDEHRHIRAFQNPGSTYHDIVSFIAKKNEDTSVIYFAGKEERIDGLTIQYDESDWAFLRRLAARLHTVLVPDCTNDSICFYFGSKKKRTQVLMETEDFEMSVNCSHNHLGRNIVEYQLVSREVWDLCTPLMIQGREVLVYHIQGSLTGGEMVWQYRLRRADEFEPDEPYNKNIIGASLFGRVNDTKEDLVKLDLECEDDCSDEKGIWFPFATVYTSSDGNGWYFMPEQGERVRLCFPDEKEKNAYISSSTYLEDVQGEKNDPEIKFIRTAQGKEIRFAPGYILITNNKGMSICLDDDDGIKIKSSGNIELTSEDGMFLSSGDMFKIDSEGGILLKQNENSIVIRDGIRTNGVRVQFR